MGMARKSEPGKKPAKKPGRIKQMVQIFNITRKEDSKLVPLMLLVFLGAIVVGVVLSLFASGGNILTAIIWVIFGILCGVLLAMIVLGRRAEAAAFKQIEGRPGAVGAVLQTSLRRGWRGSETPVAVNPRSHDAIYRAVGRQGVILIAEGPKSRTQKLVNEEHRKVQRIAPNVAVTIINVGPDEGSVPIRKLGATMRKGKTVLRRNEVAAVANRLESLKTGFGIPKGMDPTKARPDHKAMRGR